MKPKRKRLTRNQRIIRDFADGYGVYGLAEIYNMYADQIQSIIRRALRKGKR